MAVDLGSTMVDSCLIDAEDKGVLAQRSIKNPQRLYGSDVINRILTVKRDINFLMKMREQAVSAIVELLQEMLADLKKKVEHTEQEHELVKLDAAAITGNTTMISILLGYDISDMGEAPFPTILHGSVIMPGQELFKDARMAEIEEEYPEFLEEDCNVFLAGCSSAFLGGDVIAGLMHIEKNRNKDVPQRYLLLDLGTNGEMVLKDGERYLATSTACGPAFEGCARKQHAYGNSLLEAIALGRRLEKIHANGTLAEEFLDSGIVIHGISINSEILQSIMLAKAAVYAGIKCLLRTAGLHAKDIDTVYIAGGFGFYLNARDAIDLGMMPQDFMDKMEVVGNTSLAGAVDLLVHGPLSHDFEEYREKIQVIDLTQVEGFQDNLIDACSFVRLT